MIPFFYAAFLCLFHGIVVAQTIYVFPFYGINITWHVQKLESLGYCVKTTNLQNELDDFAGLVVFDQPSPSALEMIRRYPIEKRILCLLEPPVVALHYYDAEYHAYFSKVLTMFDDLVDNKKYFKIFFPQDSLTFSPFQIPFENRKLCTLIAGNKGSYHQCELYSARRAAISFFEHIAPFDFDLYGTGWGIQEFPSARGNTPNKIAVLKNYKFCICYENMRNQKGYITEKIFDVLISGCVPIYWGADNISDYVPSNCFIDRRDFKSDQDLYAFLCSISETQHRNYVAAIKVFLESPEAFRFSHVYYVDTLIRCFQDMYDKTKVFSGEQIEKLNASSMLRVEKE